MKGETRSYDEWLDIGFTKFKERTLDPQWKKDDNNVFDTPPLWTDCDVPDRGYHGAPLTGGAWVARNNIPADDPAAKKNKLSALDR